MGIHRENIPGPFQRLTLQIVSVQKLFYRDNLKICVFQASGKAAKIQHKTITATFFKWIKNLTAGEKEYYVLPVGQTVF